VSDAELTFLKFCLLAVLYLFLARVVWVVVRELRGTPIPVPAAPAPVPVAASSKSAKAAKARRQWRLVLVAPPSEAGAAYEVDDEITMGRGGGCTIPLGFDTFVSQVHARAFDRDGTLWIEDLGSRNGTFVNGEQVHEPTKVAKGARVQVGETVFEVDR
jgi:pSer/pThr/pTyr-binding forkhead associated (FHA) protein